MKSVSRLSLTKKILLLELFAIALPLIPKAYYDHKRELFVLRTEHNGKLQNIATYLSNSLESALWNYSKDEAQRSVNTLSQNELVQQILVEDSDNQSVAKSDGFDPNLNSKLIELRVHPIFRGDKNIGQIKLWVNHRALLENEQGALVRRVLWNLAVFATTLLLTLYLLNKSLLLKIHKLSIDFKKLGSEELDQPFQWADGDELNSLGQSLENTRQSLQNNFHELKKRQETLSHLNQNLELLAKERSAQLIESSRLASLGEMAAGVAHEINNPLMIISGRTTQIKKELSKAPSIDSDKCLKLAQSIDDTVFKAANIIKALKTYSRDDSKADYVNSNLSLIIKEALDLVQNRFNQAGVEIEAIGLEAPAFLDCRSVQLGQVILNLLNNAFDAIQNCNEKWVRIFLSQSDTHIQLKICDSGAGIPRSIQDKIMQPFFTTKPVGKGTGLGLSICQGIIKSHEGTLIIDNTHKNTCFLMTLPKKQEQKTKSAA